jgi:hypothetical protein
MASHLILSIRDLTDLQMRIKRQKPGFTDAIVLWIAAVVICLLPFLPAISISTAHGRSPYGYCFLYMTRFQKLTKRWLIILFISPTMDEAMICQQIRTKV